MGRVLLDFARGRLRAYIPGGFEFVAARDIVEGHRLAMDKGRTGHKYIFSSGHTSVDELMAYYEEMTGRPRPRWRLSPPLMAALAEVTSFVTTRLRPDAPLRFTPGAVRLLRLGRRADTTKGKAVGLPLRLGSALHGPSGSQCDRVGENICAHLHPIGRTVSRR